MHHEPCSDAQPLYKAHPEVHLDTAVAERADRCIVARIADEGAGATATDTVTATAAVARRARRGAGLALRLWVARRRRTPARLRVAARGTPLRGGFTVRMTSTNKKECAMTHAGSHRDLVEMKVEQKGCRR